MKQNKQSNLSDDIKLVQVIRQAVGLVLKDTVKIFTGVVTDISSAITDGTISVQQITGKLNVTIQQKDPNYSFNQQGQNADQLTSQLNAQTGPTIWNNVMLQSSPGDCMFMIPVVGSYVTVCYSTLQTPFVILYQDIIQMNNALTDDNGNATSIQQLSGTYSVNNLTNTTINSSYIQNNNSFDMKINNGIEFKLDTKASLKNSDASLYQLLNDFNNNCTQIKTTLNDISTVLQTPDSMGGSYTPAQLATVVSDISTISSNISNINTEIGNLLQ